MTDSALHIENLSKSYGEQQVLDRIELEISKGEFVALRGRSGTGKSTLLRILGLLELPDSGVALHNGRNLGQAAETERARYRRDHLGFVFQSYNLIPTLTAAENVALPISLRGASMARARSEALSALSAFSLRDCADRFPDQLSGGEQQRVAIARALGHRPELIIADEPTGNLDSATADQVARVLIDACRREGATLLLATHSHELSAAASRRIRLIDGRLQP